MEQQKQNILFEKDIKAIPLSNIYEEMENANENEHKIETPFSKKLKVKKQEVLLANTDTDMEKTTITIKPKRKYTKKPKVEVIEVPAPLTEAEVFAESEDEVETCKGCGEVDGEEQYDGYCETCHAEKLGHHAQATDQQESDDEESDEEDEEEEEVIETPIQTLTTKIILTKEQLADLERQRREIEAKAEYDAWFNNEEQVEADTMTYYEEEIQKSIEVLKRAGIDRYIGEHLGAFCDDAFVYKDIQPETIELVWKFLQKKKNPTKSAPKPKGEKGEKKAPTYEGKGKKAGTGNARAKCIERLNAGTLIPINIKKVGDAEWGSYSGGYPAVKRNGKWDCPTFKILKDQIGVKTIAEMDEWLKKQ